MKALGVNELPLNIVVCGPAGFTRAVVDACRNTGLRVVAVAVSAGDLVEQLEDSGAVGAIAPAGDGWLESMAGLVPVKANVSFFIAGNLTKAQRDSLADNGMFLLPSDPVRAVRGMIMTLERVAPAGYRSLNHSGRVVVESSDNVAVVRPAFVLFYSLKGGVGKTVTTANTAATVGLWARRLQKAGSDLTVAVLDNNPDGNLEKYFGSPLFGWRKAVKSSSLFKDLTAGASREAVLACLDYHEPSNAYFAGSVARHGRPAPGALDTSLSLLARHFHFVFVDMGVRMDDEWAAPAAGYATDVVLVSDSDPLTVALLHERWEETLGFFGGAGRFKLAVNHRAPTREGVSARKAADLLRVPLAAELPYCPEMFKSRSKSLPVVCCDPQGCYAGEVARLSQKILGTRAVGQATGKRFWDAFSLSRLFR